MHKTQMYENLMDMLEREVKEISNKSQLDPQTLDNLDKIMMTIKATDKHMEMLDGGMSQGRSNDGYYRPYEKTYDDMNSAMRGGGRSRDNFRDRSYRGQSYGQSYDNTYSRDNARQKMTSKLSTLLDDTMSEHERQAIMDCIDKIK